MGNEENNLEQPKITLHTTENTFSFCYDAANGCVKLGWTGCLTDSERDLVKYLAMCAFEDRNSYKEGFEDAVSLASEEIVDVPWSKNVEEPGISGYVSIVNTSLDEAFKEDHVDKVESS